jgi:hypothetical protein
VGSLVLRFATVECLRCGDMRQTRFPCPTCGLRPADTETDFNVERRAKCVERARAVPTESESLPTTALELMQAVT